MASSWPPRELRLAELDPAAIVGTSAHLSAVVTLKWPFSPSSSSLSITASEEDFRLRLDRGQLRVNFNGPCASAVEARGLQIGDKVVINLEGASYEELANATSRDVPWALTFTSRLVMKIKTASSDWSVLDINSPAITELPASPEPEAVDEEESHVLPYPTTPLAAGPFSFSQSDNEWATPGLFKRRVTWSPEESSSAFAIGDQGLFDEVDEYDQEHRKKRPRFSSSYRLLDGDESAEKTQEEEGEGTATMDGSVTPGRERPEAMVKNQEGVGPGEDSLEEVFTEQASPETLANIPDSMTLDLPEISRPFDHPFHITMPPPPIPVLFSGIAPDSPSLKPVPSEQLPIVSPFLNRGLTGADYISAVTDSPSRAPGTETVVNTAASPTVAIQEVDVEMQYDTAPTHQEASLRGLDGTIDSDDDFEKEFAAGPEVFVVPAEEVNVGTTATATTRPIVPPIVTSPAGPTISQLLAAQRLPSPSDDDRPAAYDSDKDSLFDDSETETRHRLSLRTLGHSPLRTAESTTPRRSVPYTKPSRLNLETPSMASPGPISAGLAEAMPGPPKTPFLYLPTPSPVVEKRVMGFPASAPPRFGVVSYGGPAAGGKGNSPIRRSPADSSPIRRRSSFWGASRDSVSNDLSAYFGRPRGGPPSKDLSAYFGRPKRVTDITPQADVSPVDKDDNDTGASNTEEELSSFSTPNAGTDVEEEDDDDVEKALEKELGGGFKSGVTTNLSDFPALSSLAWGAVVDIIGVVSLVRPTKRAKAGKKDWYMSMRVVDSSLFAGITATILRPYKEALPVVEVGDVALLRCFKISSYKHNFVATSTTNSAWAVWKENGRGRPVNISGPPVEYGDQEEQYVEDIGAWYAELDTDTRVEMERDRGEDDPIEG